MANPRENQKKRNHKKKKKKLSKALRCLIITAAAVALVIGGAAVWAYNSAGTEFESDSAVTLVIPKGASSQQVRDSLETRLGDFGQTVYRLWSLRRGNPTYAKGVYFISPGDDAWAVAGRIKAGKSSTINITFNNARLMKDVADKISAYFPWSADDFMDACSDILPAEGFTSESFPAAFMPDTYEFYASADPETVVKRLLKYRNTFWNDERRAKARALGLTPIQVATLASIVEEESTNKTEQPTIARLYLNRIDRGMKLQADPTVKFALGDFGRRRLYLKDTEVESPYNTYYINGLPPGPIRVPVASTIDFVLNAPKNNYIYMCAKPDNSHTHNFTDSYSQHSANAKAYQAYISKLNIK